MPESTDLNVNVNNAARTCWPYVLIALALGVALTFWGQDCNKTRSLARAAATHKEVVSAVEKVTADQKAVDAEQDTATGKAIGETENKIGAVEQRLNGRINTVVADQKVVDDGQNARLTTAERRISHAIGLARKSVDVEQRLNGRINTVVADQKVVDDGQNARLTTAERRIEASRRLTVNLRTVRGIRPAANLP